MAAHQSLLTLALGFALSGLLTAGYQAVTARPPRFRLFDADAGATTLAAMPFLTFAAPFIIVRNAIGGGGSPAMRFRSAFAAALVAGGWSLLSGHAVVLMLRASGVPL